MEPNPYSILEAAEKTLQFKHYASGLSIYRNTNSPTVKYSGWLIAPGLQTAQIIHGKSSLQICGKTVVAKNNEAICIPPNIHYVHTVHVNKSHSALCRWSWISFWIFGKIELFSLLEPPCVIKGKRAQRIGDISEQLALLDLIRNPTFVHLFKKRALEGDLLSLIIEVSVFRPRTLQFLKASHRLVPILNYINEGLNKRLDRKELAKLAGFSSTGFDIFFKDALGISPGQYVLKTRLERAQELLIGSNYTVDEIGQKVGFSNPFHFSRIFKAHVGTSPLFYRKKFKKNFLFQSHPKSN